MAPQVSVRLDAMTDIHEMNAKDREVYEQLFLDPVRRSLEVAQEEYNSWLEEYEERFGEQAREMYEERYV